MDKHHVPANVTRLPVYALLGRVRYNNFVILYYSVYIEYSIHTLE